MKSTGIVRPVDALGRVVIPIELRRNLGIGKDDSLEVFVEGDSIVLKKYSPRCVFCGEDKNVREVRGKYICEDCLDELKKL
ncbi:MAG: AbrB/MazE/SpoVT family DNA-binding domain-containing protein [Eubacteriales bacterium]|nr:AbrB/MazE/SpoVT family DNA-binding domain-containing protein [Eubacteriales bacterium]